MQQRVFALLYILSIAYCFLSAAMLFDPGPHGLEVNYKQASKQVGAAAFASMEG